MTEKHIKPTEAELEILQVLWEKGPSTVKTVHESLDGIRSVGYTTILKLMQIMIQKGLLTRKRDGRNHIYAAVPERKAVQRQLLDRFLNGVFGGSAQKMVMQVLGQYRASPRELKEIRQYIKKLEKDKS
ncbi:MAG: BlaI/MecI/CopY family transcriptional regulator [Bacteroidales bacterium]|nr:BlaI/MecI/CopY family transcriptional regulator [Bacteroidales bacterium]